MQKKWAKVGYKKAHHGQWQVFQNYSNVRHVKASPLVMFMNYNLNRCTCDCI